MNRIRLFGCYLISLINNSINDNYKLDRFIYSIVHPNLLFFLRPKKDFFVNTSNSNIKVRSFNYTSNSENIIFYIHGGGFVSGSIKSYSKTCYQLGKKTNTNVLLIDYRRAPENKFPNGLNDCYMAINEIRKMKEYKDKKITIVGDSAGGNLAVGVCDLFYHNAIDCKINLVLLYPCLDNIYENDKYSSVKKYGNGYILSSNKVLNYFNHYLNDKNECYNELVSPLLINDFSFLSRVLIIGADYDLLKDEGYEFYKKIKKYGIDVKYKVIKDTLHGFYNDVFGFKYKNVCNELISKFLERDDHNE